ncbi:hypothetical protein K493DRAFT_332658 [Basidiobolus meristosporus CBS 931.73]|uniref:Uncharacterized protein n=1 Tax=Basidiobolus meristosporus CBS 931.73 TaxID=1314790 RepID=A0A1Y1ZC37_9FUNG|nr:hypothetical protein K493DRAFT_332658 [Basidiobolus meristosporus CBS 931.73]|eukprot:ORY07746.1 hypothetical protein K493DRAFT_332658 [Basidiobolus meristosporus CBS 931.73]
MYDEIEGYIFRFIITGEYKYICINDGALEIRDGHFLNGSVFIGAPSCLMLNEEGVDDYEAIPRTNTLIVQNNAVSLNHEQSNEFVQLEYHPDFDEDIELLVFKHGDQYLDESLQFQDDPDRALIVQLAYLDTLNDYTAPDITPSPSGDQLVSADGVSLFTPDAKFKLSICGENGMCSTDLYEGFLIFGSHNYSQGITFRIDVDDDIYVRSAFGDIGYLGIGVDEETLSYEAAEHQQHNAFTVCDRCTNLYKIHLFDQKPQLNIKLIPTKYKSMFVISDGMYFYSVEFFKASYGEPLRVKTMDEATVFQFISL